MSGGGMRVVVICFVLLALACQAGWGEDQFETQIKRVTVVDANGVPAPDAVVYTGECLVWDNRTQTVRLTEQPPWQRTNGNGVFSFEFVRQGAGRPYFIADVSFERMGHLFIARKDPAATYTVQLEKPARIKGVIRSESIPFSDVHVDLLFDSSKDLFPLFSSDYHLDAPTHEVVLDIPCPAGCNLSLHIEGRGPAFREHQGNPRNIAALKPGEVFDAGSIALHVASGFRVFGKPAPELQVAEWVKGKPVTLAELKGKVVLLDFWGLWCSRCRGALPRLAELHRKYARDGLVIIAIHDASLNGATLVERSRDLRGLSKTSYRVAVDSPIEGTAVFDKAFGTGRTIDAYGVTAFPTALIINRSGQVEQHQSTTLEDRVYLALYGRPMPQPTALSRLLAANRGLFTTAGAATALILILGIVLGVLRLRRSKTPVREP
jgi:thiol-disulfide isomerase/thioredoxin